MRLFVSRQLLVSTNVPIAVKQIVCRAYHRESACLGSIESILFEKRVIGQTIPRIGSNHRTVHVSSQLCIGMNNIVFYQRMFRRTGNMYARRKHPCTGFFGTNTIADTDIIAYHVEVLPIVPGVTGVLRVEIFHDVDHGQRSGCATVPIAFPALAVPRHAGYKQSAVKPWVTVGKMGGIGARHIQCSIVHFPVVTVGHRSTVRQVIVIHQV